jgi:Trypsin
LLRGAAPFLGFLLLAAPAHAVIKGTASSHGSYTVRLVGKAGYCSGVVIARNALVTAAHCARTIPFVAGRSRAVTGISQSAVLDDGRRVNVSGDAVVLRLASALPPEVGSAPVGEGSGASYTIVGYGSTDEGRADPAGGLHEATLVAASPGTLIDPNRTGAIGASACFGDSGGPVLRGGMLVGIVTRASHPSAHLACGHLTHWVPLTVSASTSAGESSNAEQAAAVEQRRDYPRQKPVHAQAMQTGGASSFNPVAMVFAPVK